MSDFFICELCSSEVSVAECVTFDGMELCPHCLDERTVVCADCGRRIWSDDNEGSGERPLCEQCYDRSYTRCSSCGAIIRESYALYSGPEGDENPYCDQCYSQLASGGIHDYYFKPEPIFYGEGKRFFGVELEIDGAGECNHNARKLLEIANAETEHIYCKHDGSLDDGIEIITHPMTLDYHKSFMPWEEILRKSVAMHYLSHKANTCGLHIHVNRDTFGETDTEQEICIARILYFFEKHWEELLKFSRRTSRQLERWAARYGYKDQPREILDHAKKCSGSRYTSINLTNSATIEFRMFRGTLKYNTLIATLQLVNRVCDVALCLSDEELQRMSWTTFVSGCQEPELVQYLKERRLYINEPVEAAEEV